MHTILVPTDFSECSANAIKYAIDFADKTNRKLLFFHSAFILIPTRTTSELYGEVVRNSKNEALKKMKKFVDQIYTSLNKKRPNDTTKFIVKFGADFLDNVLELADEQFIDLVIVGTHGASGLKKVFVGSNTSHIIEKTSLPVLAVPGKYDFSGVHKVAYASADYGKINAELKKVIPTVVKLNASLDLIHIKDEEIDITLGKKNNVHEVEKSINKHFPALKAKAHVLANTKESVNKTIQAFVKSHKIDLLVTVTHKKGFFERWFAKNVTSSIAYDLKVPMLVLK